MLKPFWNKKRRLSMTGDEFEAAISKADTLPVVSAVDAGKAIVVAEDGTLTLGEAGGNADEIVAGLIEQSYSGVFRTTASYIGNNGFNNFPNMTEAYFPNCVSVSGAIGFNCPSLSYVSFPELVNGPSSMFKQASAIKSVYLPKYTGSTGSMFYSCTALEYVRFDALSRLQPSAFAYATALKTIILGSSFSSMFTGNFNNATALMSLYFLCSNVLNTTYANTGFLGQTPIYDSAYTGSFGSIYVPASLYSLYVASATWSAVSERFASIPEDWTP